MKQNKYYERKLRDTENELIRIKSDFNDLTKKYKINENNLTDLRMKYRK